MLCECVRVLRYIIGRKRCRNKHWHVLMDGNSGISLRWLSALRDHIHSINEETKKKQQQKPI